MKNIVIFIVTFMLIACTTIPPSPKKPYEYRRMPVNKNMPVEISGDPK